MSLVFCCAEGEERLVVPVGILVVFRLCHHMTREKLTEKRSCGGRASRAECRVLDNIKTGRSEGRVERGGTANCWLLTHV